jgi:hypothetical protein
MRLHRVVVLDGRRVGQIKTHRCGGKSCFGIATAAVGRPGSIAEFLWRVGLRELVLHANRGLGLLIAYLDKRGGVLGTLQGIGDNHRDVLAVVINLLILKQRDGDGVPARLGLGKPHRIIGSKDREHAGHRLGCAEIETGNAAAGDSALHEDAIGGVVDIEFGGIFRAAGDFEPAVTPVDRQSGDEDHRFVLLTLSRG